MYKYLFLILKRIGNNFVFFGLIMIYYKKDFLIYKVLLFVCVINCKGLEKCRGYIIDGEEVFDIVWRMELLKVRYFRCVKYFEGNCK